MLSERIDTHVRFEEREMFPLIESALGDDELAVLADEIERAESAPPG